MDLVQTMILIGIILGSSGLFSLIVSIITIINNRKEKTLQQKQLGATLDKLKLDTASSSIDIIVNLTDRYCALETDVLEKDKKILELKSKIEKLLEASARKEIFFQGLEKIYKDQELEIAKLKIEIEDLRSISTTREILFEKLEKISEKQELRIAELENEVKFLREENLRLKKNKKDDFV